jgi:hypothetical protein
MMVVCNESVPERRVSGATDFVFCWTPAQQQNRNTARQTLPSNTRENRISIDNTRFNIVASKNSASMAFVAFVAHSRSFGRRAPNLQKRTTSSYWRALLVANIHQ